MAAIDTLTALREAIEYAPASGPVAPDLRGVWTRDGWFLCAACVGRLIARGCGHLIRTAKQEWKCSAEAPDVCCVCRKVV